MSNIIWILQIVIFGGASSGGYVIEQSFKTEAACEEARKTVLINYQKVIVPQRSECIPKKSK